MKIEIEYINNGWIVRHNVNSYIHDSELFFKTIGQATAYAKKRLDKYRELQE